MCRFIIVLTNFLFYFQIILNIWNISHGPHIYPKRYKSILEDFREEKFMQNEIRRIFGNHVLLFCQHLANRDQNLQYLPTKLFLRILRQLAAKDILSLSQTSKIFFEVVDLHMLNVRITIV